MALFFVTTPIGNEEDLSFNALSRLKDSSTFYCEDTRKSKDLFKRLAIDYSDKAFYSYHDHSNDELINKICGQALSEDIVYISDAGSPLISDPAYPLLKAAIAKQVEYKIISGITSPIYALEVSGLPAIPFSFHGFVGRAKSDLAGLIQTISQNKGTHIFFEGVARVEKSLAFMCEEMPNHDFVVARELTKTFESIHRFTGKDFAKIKDSITFKGEFVILVHNPRGESAKSDVAELAKEVLDSKGRGKSLAKLLAKCLDLKVKDVYNQLND